MRPRSLNSTTPVTFAKRVSSLPQPTLRPGLILVPRWRTMIEPPGTSWPPKTFTPSRCALESRPFLELPKPFLCAIRHLSLDIADLDLSEGLAVSDGLLILLLPLEFEDDDLVAATLAEDRGLQRSGVHQLAAIVERGLDGDLDLGADVARHFFDADHVAGSDPVLFSAGLDNCVHHNPLVWEPEHTECVGTTGVNIEC